MNNNYKETKNYYKNAFIKEIISNLVAKDGVEISLLNDFIHDLCNPWEVTNLARRQLIDMINEEAELEAQRLCSLDNIIYEDHSKSYLVAQGGRA